MENILQSFTTWRFKLAVLSNHGARTENTHALQTDGIDYVVAYKTFVSYHACLCPSVFVISLRFSFQ